MYLIRILRKMYDYRILGLTMLIWLIITYIPAGVVPDLLNLTKVISSGTFGRLSIGFISVFSFLVTVLVLTYGFLREKFRRLALSEFLDNKFSQFLISFFISVFVTNIFAAIYLDSRPVDHNSLNVAYFSLTLSTLYFLSFIPLALISISYTDSQALVGKYIKKLKLEDFPDPHTIDALATFNENNPLSVLIQLSRSYLEKDDSHSINFIIFLSQERIESLIGDSKDREVIGRYFSGQRLIWDGIIQKAFQKKEYSSVNNIFIALASYHSHFASKKIPLLYLEELRHYIHSLIEKMVNEGLNEPVEQAMVIYQRIMETHYEKSVPAEDELKELTHFFEQTQESYDQAYRADSSERGKRIDTNLQWGQIHSSIPYFFSRVILKAIEKKNHSLYESGLNSIQNLMHIVATSNLTDRQKTWIQRIQCGEFYHFQILAIQKGLIIDRVETLQTIVVEHMIDKNSLAKEFALVASSEFLIELHQLGKLDYEAINFLGSVGRHCANRYCEHEGYAESMDYILRVVAHIKTMLEQDLKRNAQFYLWLKDAVESYEDFHRQPLYFGLGDANDKPLDEPFIARLRALKKSFQDVDFKEAEKTIYWDAKGPRDMFRPKPRKQ